MSSCNTCPSSGSCNKDETQCGIKNNPNNHIKNVIGVMSGKGGVGKSTMTALIAHSLVKQGYKVGILDADITGPSIPRLMHLGNQKAYGTENELYPVVTEDGIKVMSLNLLLEDETQPVIWRGPAVSGVVQQFWTDVLWGELDYLLIDMPPGTGDVALTVTQSIPLQGIVMVSMPQDLISMIVAKAVHMVQKVGIRVIGILQNMSYITCPDCGKKIQMLNGESIDHFLQQEQLSMLGELPMLACISNLAEATSEEKAEAIKYMEPITNCILKNL